MPQWDVLQCPPWLITLLKKPPRIEIMSSQPVHGNFFYTSYKENLFTVIFRKTGGLHWNRVFSTWFLVFRIIRQHALWYFFLEFHDRYVISGFSSNSSWSSQIKRKQYLCLKWLSLLQATAKYFEKWNLVCSTSVSIEPTMKQSVIIEAEEKPYCTSVSVV